MNTLCAGPYLLDASWIANLRYARIGYAIHVSWGDSYMSLSERWPRMRWLKVLTTATVVLTCSLCGSRGLSLADTPPALVLLLPDDNSFLDDTSETGATAIVRIAHAPAVYAGISGAVFRIKTSAGFTGTLVSEEYPPGSIIWSGNVSDGVIIQLPVTFCAGNPYYDITKMTFQLYGTSGPCSYLEIVAHPDSTTPVVWTCGLESVEPRVYRLWVNYDHYNGCPPPVATEQTTWGRVKALYR